MPQASTEHAAPHVTLVGLLDDETRCWRSSRCMKTLRRGGPLRPPVLNGMFHANAPVDSMKNALRRGGPPCPPAADGFIVWHRILWLRGVSASGLHQDDRDDHQHPPGAWFPQSREYTVLSCARQANSPGRLCLRPPPNTPLRSVRWLVLLMLKR